MFLSGPCPKCMGWLERDRDEYGPFIRCMSCGKHWDLLVPSSEVLDQLVKPRSHAYGVHDAAGGVKRQRVAEFYGVVYSFRSRR